MIKVSDYIYTIGNSHITCDDFAFGITKNNVNISVVCDGCSSSENSAVGSRFIISELIRELTSQNVSLLDIDIKTNFLDKIYKTLFDKYSGIYGNYFLDCTLLIAITVEDKTKVYVYGDGSILSATKDGHTEFQTINFDGNAPAYFSYNLDKNRLETYIKEYRSYIITDETDEIVIDKFFEMKDIPCLTFEFDHKEYDRLVLCTDGVDSFYKGTEKARNVKSKLIDFKTRNDGFFERQVNGIKRLLAKDGFYNFDDFSGIAFIFKE